MYDLQQTFMNKLASKFVKQSHLSSNLGIDDIDISRENQKDDENLALGLLCMLQSNIFWMMKLKFFW